VQTDDADFKLNYFVAEPRENEEKLVILKWYK
jgi:hypothetical protein